VQQSMSAAWWVSIIDASLAYLFGWQSSNIPQLEKRQYYSHLYSPTSVKLVVQWFDIINTARFAMFGDTTAPRTLLPLRTSIAIPLLTSSTSTRSTRVMPLYDTRTIRVPLAVFLGGRDTLIDPQKLLTLLPAFSAPVSMPPHLADTVLAQPVAGAPACTLHVTSGASAVLWQRASSKTSPLHKRAATLQAGLASLAASEAPTDARASDDAIRILAVHAPPAIPKHDVQKRRDKRLQELLGSPPLPRAPVARPPPVPAMEPPLPRAQHLQHSSSMPEAAMRLIAEWVRDDEQIDAREPKERARKHWREMIRSALAQDTGMSAMQPLPALLQSSSPLSALSASPAVSVVYRQGAQPPPTALPPHEQQYQHAQQPAPNVRQCIPPMVFHEPTFEHLDFLWAGDVHERAFPAVVAFVDRFQHLQKPSCTNR
jgi:hypothetical protein